MALDALGVLLQVAAQVLELVQHLSCVMCMRARRAERIGQCRWGHGPLLTRRRRPPMGWRTQHQKETRMAPLTPDRPAFTRRTLFACAAALLSAPLATSPWAQGSAYPSQPLHIIVP